MDRYLVGLLIMAATFAVLSWLLHRLGSGRPWIKYLPPVLATGGATHLIVAARRSTGGFEDLIRGLWAVLLLAGAVGGILTALLLDRRERQRDRES